MYPAVPYLSIFSLFSLPRTLPSTPYLTHLFSFLGLTLIVIFSLRSLCRCCCCSVAHSCLSLCDPMDCSMPASLSFSISRSLLKFMPIESMMPFNHLIFCCPLLILPSVFPRIRVVPKNQLFASDGQSIRVSASASVLPMKVQG